MLIINTNEYNIHINAQLKTSYANISVALGQIIKIQTSKLPQKMVVRIMSHDQGRIYVW